MDDAVKSVLDLVVELEKQSKKELSKEEQVKREDSINFARNNVALEGVVLDDFMERLNTLYIDGVIDSPTHTKLFIQYVRENTV